VQLLDRDPVRLLRCLGTLALVGTALGGATGVAGTDAGGYGGGACRPPAFDARYAAEVGQALRARQDVWGNKLLREPGGPTFESARKYLTPLLLAGQPRLRRLTDSGVYYVPFGRPREDGKRAPVALHVADGSEIISDRVGGSKLVLGVGPYGGERYGSCLSRLETPRLHAGYYPVLQTTYMDGNSVRFRQESFTTRVAETDSLVSFVRLEIDVPNGSATEQIRLTPSETGLTVHDGRLLRGRDTVLFFSDGGRFDGSSLAYSVSDRQTITLARLVRPHPSRAIALDHGAYEQARRRLIAYWDEQLSRGATFVAPDRRVLAAERNLLIQNLLMTWRYSVGNSYEKFEFPESLENAAVLGDYGFAAVDRQIVEEGVERKSRLYPNWGAGTRLLAGARYYQLFRDRSFVAAATPALRRSAELLERQLNASGKDLLRPERYTADLPDVAYGLPAQAVAWQGLSAIARVWAATGHQVDADRASRAAARLGTGLRRAVRASATKLRDGSLFLPARLLDGERPYASVTESTRGSYWNLVVQDALASGLFPPHGRVARGVLEYMLRHGSRLVGLVRAGAYSLYGKHAPHTASGTNAAYGLNIARFLADNDRPDQLVLSLYGALALGMAENTLVSGEAASVAPIVSGQYYRSMYLPPNSTSNAAFLECLRLTLVHETAAPDGEPRGLELAYSTPRAWLANGKRITVRDAPTSFGRISFSIRSLEHSIRVHLQIPERAATGSLRLRLRRPDALRISRVELDSRPYRLFHSAAEEIDLTGQTGSVTLAVHYTR
jgi:hypothetical protein